MDTRELARYAYHNCEFVHAINLARRGVATPEAFAIQIKAHCELDEGARAAEVAEEATSLLPMNGMLHYLRGQSYYLAGKPKNEIEEAFFAATECDYAGGNMGLALLAFAVKRVDCAVDLLRSAMSDDPELEHIRQLMMFQAHLGREDLEAAEDCLRVADRILRQQRSLLRQFWGQLCWTRLMRARGLFEGALAIVERLLDQMDDQLTPRLFRNAMVEKHGVIERESFVRIKTPREAGDLRAAAVLTPSLGEISRKPMLHSLYAFLTTQGGRGATKEEIVTRVWEESYNPLIHDDRIYKAIGRLRKLLGDDQSAPRFLTQLGRNYVLTLPDEPVASGGRA